MSKESDRRPIAARSSGWAKALTSILVQAGITPNQISVVSVVVATAGAVLFFFACSSAWQRSLCLLGAAACIQLRLLCNMLDGMVAVEGGKQSKTGALFNELPDRLADSLFLVLSGFAAQSGDLGIELGWAAALLAVLTAYIRAFGASQGLKQDFCGPMAKQHRMFTLTVASVLGAVETATGSPPRIITAALTIVVAGSIITCFRRTKHIFISLRQN